VAGAGGLAATLRHLVKLGAQIINQAAHGGGIGQKIGSAGAESGLQNRHGAAFRSSIASRIPGCGSIMVS
jgi:hypothetical protein